MRAVDRHLPPGLVDEELLASDVPLAHRARRLALPAPVMGAELAVTVGRGVNVHPTLTSDWSDPSEWTAWAVDGLDVADPGPTLWSGYRDRTGDPGQPLAAKSRREAARDAAVR